MRRKLIFFYLGSKNVQNNSYCLYFVQIITYKIFTGPNKVTLLLVITTLSGNCVAMAEVFRSMSERSDTRHLSGLQYSLYNNSIKIHLYIDSVKMVEKKMLHSLYVTTNDALVHIDAEAFIGGQINMRAFTNIFILIIYYLLVNIIFIHHYYKEISILIRKTK